MRARSYQTEAVSKTVDFFIKWPYEEGKPNRNPVIAMPTGTGKSVVIALFLKYMFETWPQYRQKVLVLTHVKELIQQNYNKLVTMWKAAPAGIYSSGLGKRDYVENIIFAGIASVNKKYDLFGKVDLIIVDECQLINPTEATMYMNFIDAMKLINPRLRVIGLTATPYRLGYGRITDPIELPDGTQVPALFTDMCFDITNMHAFNRLIAEGYLARLVPKSTRTKFDLDGVHMRGGEFIAGELQRAVNKDQISRAAIQEALEYADERKCWLVFCAGVEHACDVADIMNEMGIPTVAIHSKMGDAARDQAILDFKAGKYKAVTNNNVLTTGFDHPPIDLILALRPTSSTVLWVQMLGRGTRPYDPKRPGEVDPLVYPERKRNCLVLDFSGNSRRLGPINDPVLPRRKGKGGGEAPIKECDVCGTMVHASLRFCNAPVHDPSHPDADEYGDRPCNAPFEFETKLQAEASTAPVLKGEDPIVEVFKVDSVTYSRHIKVGKPDGVRVSYFCGLKKFTAYVLPEHGGYGTKRARDWWRTRTSAPLPDTTDATLVAIESLPAPTHLRIWVNCKYPEILAECFDGTAFGNQEDDGARPQVESSTKATTLSRPVRANADTHDADGDEYGF